MNSIFELTIIDIDYPPLRDYHYTVRERKRIYFSSHQEADEYVHSHITELQTEGYIFCFYLREKPMSLPISDSYYMSIWLYDSDGKLIDKRLISTIEGVGNETMRWRRYNECRFKPGDIVERKDGNEISLCYIAGRDLSKEEIQHSDEHALKLSCAADEDQMVVIEDDSFTSHSHVDCLNLFKPHFKIPSQTLKKYKEMRELYLLEINKHNN